MKSVTSKHITLLPSVIRRAEKYAKGMSGNKSVSEFISFLICDYDRRIKKQKRPSNIYVTPKQLMIEI
jgi:hypothetical protein